MKKLAIILLLVASLQARADLIISYQFDFGDQVQNSVMKIKGDKVRMDTGAMMSSIIDYATGEIISILPEQKRYMKTSMPETQKPGEDSQAVVGGSSASPAKKAEFVDTGRKERVNGYDTKVYTVEAGSVKNTMWFAKNFPNGDAICKEMLRLQHSPCKPGVLPIHTTAGLGFPLKTETVVNGKTFTMTILSAQEAPVNDSDLAPPADYTEIKAPAKTSGSATIQPSPQTTRPSKTVLPERERLEEAAAQGDRSAANMLAICYEMGRGVPKDETKAIEWRQKAAEMGNVHAQCNLAFRNAYGKGVPKDEAKATQWYEKAAAQGDASAQFDLGYRYEHGKGVGKDDGKAIEWYQKAADQGDKVAKTALGSLYLNGKGQPKDESRIAEWFRKLAEQGDSGAQLTLGRLYARGRGVPKDDAQAAVWYQKAAAQGDINAQFRAGEAYANGIGVPKDEAKASDWYRKSFEGFKKLADQGHAFAQAQIGNMYANGQGVPNDDVQADAWLKLAAASGCREDIQARDNIEQRLTPEQKAEAQNLSVELSGKIHKNYSIRQ